MSVTVFMANALEPERAHFVGHGGRLLPNGWVEVRIWDEAADEPTFKERWSFPPQAVKSVRWDGDSAA